MKIIRIALGAGLLVGILASAYAHKVIGIADGDTMTVLVDRKPVKLRLANIDAPEKAQAFGQKSKQSLSDLCWGKDAQYDAQTIDRYGRTVAVVRCAGVEANRAQVERGMAWVYAQYNKDGGLPSLEQQARVRHAGLWADPHAVAPWVGVQASSGEGRQTGSACSGPSSRVQYGAAGRVVPNCTRA